MQSRIELLNEIGILLSSERDTEKLLETILQGAMTLTHADSGSLYLLTENNTLQFKIVINHSLGWHKRGKDIHFQAIPLYLNDKENHSMVVAYAVLEDETVNIADVYHAEGFDFSGTRDFDKGTGYRTQAILTIPMKDHKQKIIGVLQLINPIDKKTKDITAFSLEDQRLAESLASQAAITLTTKTLIEEQKILFEAFIKLVAEAIDEKSPYTGAHCRRVPELTMMIADACVKQTQGMLSDFTMNTDDRYELSIAGWLHDCGKLVTPEHIIDKANKLQTIYDRIHTVDTRFELIKRDKKIAFLEAQLQYQGEEEILQQIKADYLQQIAELDAAKAFIRKVNKGGEFMQEQDKQRILDIAAQYSWENEGEKVALLDENEIYNLSIERGTLTTEEREIINNHMAVTIKMLEALPLPKHLKHVPEFAGGHHEHMDGKGFPKGLKRDELSIQARIMAIADIFEALTARDRPYKEGKKMSECLAIMDKMKAEQHIDPDIYDVFIKEKVYMDYAKKYLPQSQIDVG